MHTLPDITQPYAPSGPRPTSLRVLLVGEEAHELAQNLAGWQVSTANSVLEAVLVSGGAGATDSLILVAIANELDHLEAGIRSLRQVNAGSRIVLLCDPMHGGFGRRALNWGADDYFILPLDSRAASHLTASRPPAAVGETHPPHRLAPTEPTVPLSPDTPALPLPLQTEMLEQILAGAALRPDFAQHAIATLKTSLGLSGTLRFLTSDLTEIAPSPPSTSPAPTPPREYRRPVAFAGQAPFGTLIWQPEKHSSQPPATDAGILAQASHWLAAMLAMAQRYEQLRLMAITDELSGAYNRRYFVKYMTGLLERAREARFRVTLLLFDIDDFKQYNDQFGHASGDAIIRELIRLLRACTRPHDLVARIGGDEFAVVYWDNEAPRQPNSEHPKEILAATERFREAIKSHAWPQACNIKGEISISGGLAAFPWDADTLETLMAKADEALLKAKAAGKNVILLHEPKPADVRI